ncbi:MULTISPECIES: DUF5050 domain-containing protein [unclassified Paenibacillus]|uniref:DUF5050 domain-containing protein n=1 Tax=unclassified Paenibacillus TaxID=185978 RepID=UPI003634ABDB
MLRTITTWTITAAFAAGLALIWPLPASQAASSVYPISYPTFPVTINETIIDQVHSVYPLLLYRDITYFPMTWDYTSALGLTAAWNGQKGLSIAMQDKKAVCSPLKQTLSAQANSSTGSASAIPAPFPVTVNGSLIDNTKEPYPVLFYNDITYFPMTWKFTKEAFNWQVNWDNARGYEIQSCVRPTQEKLIQTDSFNLANGGQLAAKDDWIYMNPSRSSGGAHSLVKAKEDGSNRMKLSDDNAMSINIVGDWLYYINFEATSPSAIYKIRTDGTDRTMVSQTAASRLWVRDGWMYYFPSAEQPNEMGGTYQTASGIFRMKTDGTSEQKLLEDMKVSSLYLYGEHIYFRITEGEHTRVYTMNLDGSGQKMLRSKVTDFIVADDWIYYVLDRKQMYKMSLDGSVDIPLFELEKPQLSSMTYWNGWIYYTKFISGSIAGANPIERIRIDGTDQQKVTEARPLSLYIAGNEMYFANWSMGDQTLEHFKLDN